MKILVLLFVLFLGMLSAQEKSESPNPIRMSNCVGALPLLLKQVQPEYPAIAKVAGVEGVVMFQATVTKKGQVDKKSVRLMSHDVHPVLVKAARDAFVQWQYKPVLSNGEPIPVPVLVEINFTLR